MAIRKFYALVQRNVFVALIPFFQLLPALSLADPSVLYHWTSERGLNRWASNIQSQGEFVLKPIDSGSIFAEIYPQFQNQSGLFTWINAATGVGSFMHGTNEWYAREDDHSGPPRLVVIELKPGVVVETLDTVVDYSERVPRFVSKDPRGDRLQAGNVGLVFHRVIDSQTGQPAIQEFILLKRGLIASISAAPAVVNPILEQEIKRLASRSPYSDAELHTIPDGSTEGLNSAFMRNVVRKKFLRTMENTGSIPQVFLGNACSRVVSDSGGMWD